MHNINLSNKNKKYNNLGFIICKTPLRISLFGGGSDLPSFIDKVGHGHVVNLTINKYVYTCVKIHSSVFNKKYRLNYFKTENVDTLKEIKNNIIKSSIKYYNINFPLYISNISDVPSGTGLGSSGAFLVSLCQIFNKINFKKVSNKTIAREASEIDLEILKNKSGYQDQYASSIGGFNEFFFYKKHKVSQRKLGKFSQRFLKKLESRSILIFSGKTRNSSKILKFQNSNMKKKSKIEMVKKMMNISKFFTRKLKINIDHYKLYLKLLKISWGLKKNLSNLINTPQTNRIINILYKENVSAYKILGAGGGGFILASFENEKQKFSFKRKFFKKLKILNFKYEEKGTLILK